MIPTLARDEAPRPALGPLVVLSALVAGGRPRLLVVRRHGGNVLGSVGIKACCCLQKTFGLETFRNPTFLSLSLVELRVHLHGQYKLQRLGFQAYSDERQRGTAFLANHSLPSLTSSDQPIWLVAARPLHPSDIITAITTRLRQPSLIPGSIPWSGEHCGRQRRQFRGGASSSECGRHGDSSFVDATSSVDAGGLRVVAFTSRYESHRRCGRHHPWR